MCRWLNLGLRNHEHLSGSSITLRVSRDAYVAVWKRVTELGIWDLR